MPTDVAFTDQKSSRAMAPSPCSFDPELACLALESVHDYAISTFDPEGRVTGWNPGAEKLFGYTADEIFGQPADILFLPQDRAIGTPQQELQIAQETGLYRNERWHPRKDGSRFFASGTVRPMRDEAGQLIGFAKVCRDVTEQFNALTERERLFEVGADLLAIIACDGQVRWASPVWERTLGWSATDLKAHHWLHFVHPEDHAASLAAVEAQCDGSETLRFENRYRCKNGSYRWLSWKLKPNPAQKVFYAGATDVTERKEAEQRAHRLAAIVEYADDGIVSKTLEGTITSWNKGAERLFGYTAPEMIGRPVTLLVPNDRLGEETEILARLRDGKRIESYETIRVRKDGTFVHVSLTISPIRDENGKIIGASKIARDITERKKIESALRDREVAFRALADNIAQLAWMTDENGSIFWYNKRWFDFTGTTMEEMQGWGWQTVHHPEHLERVTKRWRQQLQRGETWEDVFPLRGKDGNYRWFLSRAVPIRDEHGRVMQWFGTNTDITEQLEAEQALRVADRRKDEFLAMLAHELRNPLAAIRNAQQLCRSDAEHATDSSTVSWALDVIDRQSSQLARIVDDLLDVSRITRGKIHLRKEHLDAAKVLDYAVMSVRPLISERKHELTTAYDRSGSLLVEADPTRLEQIVGNLLTNAAKYTENGGHIWLEARREEKQVVIRVRDSGMGIPPEKVSEMFELFAQGERSISRSEGGLGIGLTVVKKLTEMHGGTVTAHSGGPGMGSEFIVTLPAAEPAGGATTASAPESGDEHAGGSHKGTRVLIVDDHVDTAQSMARLLRLRNHQVEVVHEGRAAFEKACAFHPDVVLLDIGLPGMDGYEVANRLRSHEGCSQNAVIIAISGYAQEEDRRRSKAAGFDHHLVKPVDFEELRQLIEEVNNPS